MNFCYFFVLPENMKDSFDGTICFGYNAYTNQVEKWRIIKRHDNKNFTKMIKIKSGKLIAVD